MRIGMVWDLQVPDGMSHEFVVEQLKNALDDDKVKTLESVLKPAGIFIIQIEVL